MENQQPQNENKELISWHKPEVQILTISEDTSLVNSSNTPILVDKE